MGYGVHNPVSERIEAITYSPGILDTADLEAATKTITALTEAVGTVNADYNKVLLLPIPSDARLAIKLIASRLAVTIDSFDLATILYCRVYVDTQDEAHRLFDLSWNAIGAKVTSTRLSSGANFNLLKNGGNHTFYFFFWVNQANNAIISLVQLWEGVGSNGTNTSLADTDSLEITHIGTISLSGGVSIIGTGNKNCLILTPATSVDYCRVAAPETSIYIYLKEFISSFNCAVCFWGSVATDIICLERIYVRLRSER